MQCSNLSVKFSDMNTRSIVLNDCLASHVIVPFGSVSDRLDSSIMFNS